MAEWASKSPDGPLKTTDAMLEKIEAMKVDRAAVQGALGRARSLIRERVLADPRLWSAFAEVDASLELATREEPE